MISLIHSLNYLLAPKEYMKIQHRGIIKEINKRIYNKSTTRINDARTGLSSLSLSPSYDSWDQSSTSTIRRYSVVHCQRNLGCHHTSYSPSLNHKPKQGHYSRRWPKYNIVQTGTICASRLKHVPLFSRAYRAVL